MDVFGPFTDTFPPRLVSAEGACTLDAVTLQFDEPVLLFDPVFPTNAARFSIDGGLTVLSAGPSPAGCGVLLRTSPQVEGASYTVTIAGVRDQAPVPNVMASNATASFVGCFLTPFQALSPARLSPERSPSSSTGPSSAASATDPVNYQIGRRHADGDQRHAGLRQHGLPVFLSAPLAPGTSTRWPCSACWTRRCRRTKSLHLMLPITNNCPEDCLTLTNQVVICDTNHPGCYTWDFDLRT
jgi:hypothetical protein